MYFLNYIYFAIITYFGIKFLTSGGRIVKNPLVKDQKMKLDGPEMFWVLTFSTGLLAFSAPAGLDLMAIRLMVLEVLCIIGLMVVKNKPGLDIAAGTVCGVSALGYHRLLLQPGSDVWIPSGAEISVSVVDCLVSISGST